MGRNSGLGTLNDVLEGVKETHQGEMSPCMDGILGGNPAIIASLLMVWWFCDDMAMDRLTNSYLFNILTVPTVDW